MCCLAYLCIWWALRGKNVQRLAVEVSKGQRPRPRPRSGRAPTFSAVPCFRTKRGKGDEDEESIKRKLAQHSVVRCCIRCRRNLAKERGAHKKQQLEDERYGDGAWQQGNWLKLPSASAFRHAARTRRSVISESAWVILGP